MKSVVALCVLSVQLIFSCHGAASPPQQKQVKRQTGRKRPQNSREWRAATYLGLTIGKSHRTNVVRVFGEPKRVDRPPGQALDDRELEIWYVYDNRGELPGELTVVMDERTDIVLRIDLAPANLSKEDAVKHFGPDFILTRYAFDDCLGNEESAPLYESAEGSLLIIEYRHRGIGVLVTESGKVQTISYVSKPMGAPKSKCKPQPPVKRE